MLAQASFIGFVKTLLIILLIILGIRILFRILLPYILRFFFNRVGERIQKEFQNYQQNPQSPYNDYNNPTYKSNQNSRENILNREDTTKNPKATRQVGEYIDYEEI